MENTRQQQIAADALVTAAVLALGAVLVVAGKALAGNVAPGGSGDWLRIDPVALDGAQWLSVDVLLGLLASLVGLAVVAWWLLSAALAISSALLVVAGAHRAARTTGAFAPAFMRRLALALLGISLVSTPAAHAQGLPDPAWQPAVPNAGQTPYVIPPALTAGESAIAPTAPSALAASPAAAPAPAPAASLVPSSTLSPSSPLPPSPAAIPHWSGPVPVPGTVPSAGAPSIDKLLPAASRDPLPQAAWVPAALPADPGPLVRQPTRSTTGPRPVEVRPGDTLWSIVARHLGPGASDLQIAESWPAWYDANAGLIGDDPNVIQPGALLVPPG